MGFYQELTSNSILLLSTTLSDLLPKRRRGGNCRALTCRRSKSNIHKIIGRLTLCLGAVLIDFDNRAVPQLSVSSLIIQFYFSILHSSLFKAISSSCPSKVPFFFLYSSSLQSFLSVTNSLYFLCILNVLRISSA